MKHNAWTLALIGAGVVSLPAVIHAEESTNVVLTALSATTISGYVDTSAHWNPGTGNANLPVYTPNGKSGSTKADGFNLDVVTWSSYEQLAVQFLDNPELNLAELIRGGIAQGERIALGLDQRKIERRWKA